MASFYEAAVSATNTTTDDTFVETSDDFASIKNILIGITGGVFSLVTIAGNLMVMISFKMDKQLQTISNYFLFSLAVADMIIGAISMPLFTAFIIQQKWTMGRAVCDSWLSVDYLASNASVLNLLVISFDRYFSVTRPLTYRARRTTKKAALMIFSAWAVSAVVWPPWIIAWPYIEGERTVPDSDCYVQFIYSNEYMAIVTVMIAFFVPVTIMIGLYVRVWWETVKRQRELVHLQAAGKRASSKRSDSSDETNGDGGALVKSSGMGKSVFRRGWRTARNGRGNNGSNRSKGSQQDITYVPTSMFKTQASSTSLTASRNNSRLSFFHSLCPAPLHACCAVIMGNAGIEDASSEGGYMTPRSLETPVQGLLPSSSTGGRASAAVIRDPYAPRHHLHGSLRHSASIEGRLPPRSGSGNGTSNTMGAQERAAYNEMRRTNSAQHKGIDQRIGDDDQENIYTILIRFPPTSINDSSPDGAAGSSSISQHNHQMSRRVPSIQMLMDDDSAASALVSRLYPSSLPLSKRGVENVSNNQHHQDPNKRGISRANPSAPSSPQHARRQLPHQRPPFHRAATTEEKLPLDARLVPKQLIRAQQDSSSGFGGMTTNTASHSMSMLSVASTGLKKPAIGEKILKTNPKKPTSEKKQDRKAAKTLSAILLAFIITWTPYSVLVVLNSILGKAKAEAVIPSVLWDFSYYLCYINSTVNPMLYALCNAAFRRTYLRIMTCRWGSERRQPINRYYYG